MGWLLLISLIVLIAASVPSWPYSRSWGYGPSGFLSFLVLVLFALMLTGRL